MDANDKTTAISAKLDPGIGQLLDSFDFLGKAPPKQAAPPVGGMPNIDSFMGPPPLQSGGGAGGGGGGMDIGAILKLLGPLLGA